MKNSTKNEINSLHNLFDPFEIKENDKTNTISKTKTIKDFLFKNIIYIIGGFILLIIIIIIIIVSSREKEVIKQIENNQEETLKLPPIDYSQKTSNYINFISELEEKNYIAYQYDFQNNSKPSFANKYQHLYQNDTSLIPNDSEVGNYLFKKESYLTIETEEVNYYKNILKKTPPEHYIYGPSSIKENYNKGQKLYNSNIKLNDTKDWEGITLSLNIKQYPKMGNSNGGYIFGWGNDTWQKRGFYIGLIYGSINFKQGQKVIAYSYEDSVKLGYNNSIPEKRYLTYRPLTDERWHQIILSMRKVNKDDEKYLNELNLKEGDFKCELFIDGESRKNSTANPGDYYGEFSAFNFDYDEKNKQHNDNFYFDNIIVLKKGENINEVKILYESIDQKAVIVIPDLKNERCKIPGKSYGLKPEEIYPDSQFPLKAETRFFQFTNKWSCLGFSYESFIKERLKEFCSDHLEIADLHYLYGKIQNYQYQRLYNYDVIDVLSYYYPKINENFKDLISFRKYVKISSTNENGNDKKEHIISNFGYWISSEGLLHTEKVSKEVNGTIKLHIANVNFFAYFEIDGGYINNRIYTISVKNSDDIKFTYNEKKIISYAIKVNQVGYSPSVKHHYGYIGRWMGTYGKLSLDEYVGKQFKLIQNEKEVYSGTIEWRLKEDPRYLVSGTNTSLNGEETLLLDISNYTGRGENYYFYIEGIGRSLNFSISYKGVFTAFYTHMKGLYNQRTGIEHKKPYTYWEVPPHHKGIYVAHHIPNNYHYSKNYIIDDNTNEGFDGLTQFKMIKETRTDEYWEEVYGGHADAGDYDNRPYHLSMIDILACVYLLRKDLLMDNQLNIPESNDNIPDILNELEWSLLIHYKVQQRLNNGSVSTWIESTSHPGALSDNGTDSARYYVGLSTREDTLRYAEAAAMLSFCFKECNSCPEDKYKKWLKSAEWAFNWGINEDNQCIYSFTFEGRNLTYREPKVPQEIIARAALVLYKLTEDDKYKKYIFKNINATKVKDKYTEGVTKLQDVRGISPINAMPVVLFKNNPDFDLFLDLLNTSVWKHINIIINNQNNATQYTYRNAYYYTNDHVYYSSLGWGGFTGGNQLEMLGIGLFLNDGTEPGNIILQSISYFNDFELGCNHYGRTFTTGLGHHFPIHFVSGNNWWYNSKNIFDPIPGITLYTFFGGLEYDSISKLYRIQVDSDLKSAFYGMDFPLSPSFVNLTNIPENYTDIRNHLWNYIPFWRRIANLEGYTIRSSEYTVYETIVKMALSTGLLLGKDENVNQCNGKNNCPSIFPNDELIHKAPRKDIKDLLGRWSIP